MHLSTQLGVISCNDLSNNIVTGVANSSLNCFSTRGCILSGPGDFDGLISIIWC